MTQTTIISIIISERSDRMNIRKLRKELKLTQADLAIKCNVSLTTIQLWEREVTTPSKENMIKLKKALEVVDQNG